MNIVSVNYSTTHELKGNNKYVFAKGRAFNIAKGIELKKQYKNGSVGFYIDREFVTLKELRKNLVKIEAEKTPF